MLQGVFAFVGGVTDQLKHQRLTINNYTVQFTTAHIRIALELTHYIKINDFDNDWELEMTSTKGWTRQQLLVAFNLYCQLQFGKLHSRNPEIIKFAKLIGRTPSALAMKLTNIASLDPAITATGRKGLKGASSTDRAMWQEMQCNWEAFAIESSLAIKNIQQDKLTEDSENTSSSNEEESEDYSAENQTVTSSRRIGQNFFRKSVLSAYGYRCCISGLSVPQLLVASHIIPWRADPENRLNPRNGLSLSTIHDKAFDIGIIAIADDMTILVSEKITQVNDHFFQEAILDFKGKPIAKPEKFRPHTKFLEYHRKHIFESWR